MTAFKCISLVKECNTISFRNRNSFMHTLTCDHRLTNSKLTILMLEESGLPYTFKNVPTQQENCHTFLQTPLFEKHDSSFIAFDPLGIAVYIDSLSSSPIFSSNPCERAVCFQWVNVASRYAKPAIDRLFFSLKVGQLTGSSLGDDELEILKKSVEELLDTLNDHLMDQEPKAFFASKEFSIADAFLLVEVSKLEELELTSMLQRYPRLFEWYTQCKGRDSWKTIINL